METVAPGSEKEARHELQGHELCIIIRRTLNSQQNGGEYKRKLFQVRIDGNSEWQKWSGIVKWWRNE